MLSSKTVEWPTLQCVFDKLNSAIIVFGGEYTPLKISSIKAVDLMKI